MSKNLASHSPSKARLWMALGWLLFVTSMVVWWWLFGLSEITNPSPIPIDTKQRMFLWEGVIFLSAIIVGGLAFVYFIYKDIDRHQQLRNFFSIFTHDIKTSIARLRLQADLLREAEEKENLSVGSKNILHRLTNDINRLDLQLENALFISRDPKEILLSEKFLLSQVVERIRPECEELEIKIERQALIHADMRAFTSCLRNLMQNSILHGQATVVEIQAQNVRPGTLQIFVQDNGKGFHGNVDDLGSAVMPTTDLKGNGIGLYLTKRIFEKMGGQIFFESSKNGFRVRLIIAGDVA